MTLLKRLKQIVLGFCKKLEGMTRVIFFQKVKTKEYKTSRKMFANFRIRFLKDVNEIMEN